MDQRVNDDLLLIDYFLSDDFLLQETQTKVVNLRI